MVMIMVVIVITMVMVMVMVAATRMGVADRATGALLDRSGTPQAADQNDGRQDGENDPDRGGHGKRWHLVVPTWTNALQYETFFVRVYDAR